MLCMCDELLFYHYLLEIECYEVQTFPSLFYVCDVKFAPRFMVLFTSCLVPGCCKTKRIQLWLCKLIFVSRDNRIWQALCCKTKVI
jgi:hypothetical protein